MSNTPPFRLRILYVERERLFWRIKLFHVVLHIINKRFFHFKATIYLNVLETI